MHFIQQGQWRVQCAAGYRDAECIEQVGFGVVGAVIDLTGEGYLLRYLLATPDLIEVCEEVLAKFVPAGIMKQVQERIRAAIAKAKGDSQ